jgi:hypothetical protein
MTRLILELELEAIELEYLATRIVQLGGTRPPQPIVRILDAPPDPEEDPDWDELTARGETIIERTTRVLARMGL